MATYSLSNHVRKYRKRARLSQQEVAYLLGVRSSAKVCRHERFAMEPSLHTVIAYTVIFQRSISELFPGMCERIEDRVKDCAAKLLERKSKACSSLEPRRHDALAAILDKGSASKP